MVEWNAMTLSVGSLDTKERIQKFEPTTWTQQHHVIAVAGCDYENFSLGKKAHFCPTAFIVF